ncbi:MAG: hypothetical protein IPJ19_00325 [Planctomycetes bacterium]|nr:hypothetical protein [Planctomycetota bacterium]
MASRSDSLLVLGFCAALLAPALAWRAHPEAWVDLGRENRKPAPFPELAGGASVLELFPRGFEAWQSDVLGLRSPLLACNNLLELRGWGRAPTQTLLLGRSDWIFYTGDHSREIWRGLYPIPGDFADNWRAALRSRTAWFARRGITYLYVIAPNKETLYPEFLPAGEEALGPTLFDALDDELAARPELAFCDLRPALRAERAHDRPEAGDFVYHPFGTHWTSRGAVVAAAQIERRLRELEPDLRWASVPPREEWALEERADTLEDTWATSLHIEGSFPQRVYDLRLDEPRSHSCTAGSEDQNTRETVFERPDGEGERVVLVHDSFGPWLRGPLSESCSYLHGLWEEDLPLERILADAPRVVIEVRTERRLPDRPVWLYDAFESLAQESFDALTPLETLPALPKSIGAVASYGGSRVERDEASGGARISSPEGGSRVLLAGWKTAPGGRLVIGLSIRAPQATQATLWYQTHDEPCFHPRRYNVMQLDAGLNELWLRLPEAGIEGTLLLQPGAVAGDYVLEHVEGRSAR